LDAQQSAELVAKEEIAYGTMLGAAGLGGFLVWLGIQALDPTWTVGTVSGHGAIKLLKAALDWLGHHVSPTVRGSIVIGIGVLSLVLAVVMVLDAILWRKPMLIVDANGIESLSEKGKGRLAWKDITAVHQVEKTLLISGAGPGAVISVGTGEIDKTVKEIYAAIACHRPEILPGRQPTAGPQASPA
jgi:hypothetical protein